jgi:hypothetical protein
MAKSKSSRARARKSAAADQKPTTAERNQAIRYLQKHSRGAHVPRPTNTLVQGTPANTIDRCRRVVGWLAYIDQPFTDTDLGAAQGDVLRMVVDALEHAEKIIRSIGSLSDAEVAHGCRA